MNLLDLRVYVKFKTSKRMHNLKIEETDMKIYYDVSLKEIFMDYKIRFTMR